MNFKLTYATMFNPPAEMHTRFDAALAELNRSLGATHPLYINGEDRVTAKHDTRRSPIDQRRVLGHFSLATVDDVNDAMAAAQAALSGWRATPMEERVRSLKRVAALIEERVYDIGAAMSLEVGKNRMEALGEVQETADFFNLYADDYAGHNGFDNPLPDDPLPDFRSHNRSVMKPYGVWVVIAPY
ncbi:MAG: aldehyde dehydrogenase family protein, partial [Pseudolabrys sp.]